MSYHHSKELDLSFEDAVVRTIAARTKCFAHKPPESRFPSHVEKNPITQTGS